MGRKTKTENLVEIEDTTLIFWSGITFGNLCSKKNNNNKPEVQICYSKSLNNFIRNTQIVLFLSLYVPFPSDVTVNNKHG